MWRNSRAPCDTTSRIVSFNSDTCPRLTVPIDKCKLQLLFFIHFWSFVVLLCEPLNYLGPADLPRTTIVIKSNCVAKLILEWMKTVQKPVLQKRNKSPALEHNGCAEIKVNWSGQCGRGSSTRGRYYRTQSGLRCSHPVKRPNSEISFGFRLSLFTPHLCCSMFTSYAITFTAETISYTLMTAL